MKKAAVFDDRYETDISKNISCKKTGIEYAFTFYNQDKKKFTCVIPFDETEKDHKKQAEDLFRTVWNTIQKYLGVPNTKYSTENYNSYVKMFKEMNLKKVYLNK